MSSTTHDDASADEARESIDQAHAAEPDESIAVSAWVQAVRAELAEFDQPGDSVCRNVRGVVALARANAERIGHPHPGDLLWWARALDRWARRAADKDREIAELRHDVKTLRHDVKTAERSADDQIAANSKTLDAIAELVKPGAVLDDAAILDAVRELVTRPTSADAAEQRAEAEQRAKEAEQRATEAEQRATEAQARSADLLARLRDEWRPGVNWPSPSALRVLWPIPFVGTFDKAEDELTMALAVATCARLGGWQPITVGDLAETLGQLITSGTIQPNPFVRPDLLGCIDRGWLRAMGWGPEPKGSPPLVVLTEASADRLRRWLP